jgi:hypothetical protein
MLGNRTFQEMQQRSVVDGLGIYKLAEVNQVYFKCHLTGISRVPY